MTRVDMILTIEQEIERLESIRKQLQELHLGMTPSEKRRNLSEDGRRRIVEAQRRRWASVKSGTAHGGGLSLG
jgi:hypothetical protein